MFENKEKELIIVSNKKEKTNAYFLTQLISSSNSEEDRCNVDKSGSISAVVWEEKHFLSSEPGLSSDNAIIFIGNFKTANEHLSNIKFKFNKCGIRYGWLGKRAVITVEDRIMSQEEVEEFNAICNELNEIFEKKIKSNVISRIPNWAKYAMAILRPGGIVPIVVGLGITEYLGFKNRREQMKLQYEIAILKFYMDSINEFLGD